MTSPINKYGEIEIIGDEVQYSIPISYTEVKRIEDLERLYEQTKLTLSTFYNYLFVQKLTLVNSFWVMLSYPMTDLRAYSYLRELNYEDQLYYFRSLITLARNGRTTPIWWDTNNLFVDMNDGEIKALVFEFEGHPLYNPLPTLDGLKHMILQSFCSEDRALGKVRSKDFIDQRQKVIQFAQQIIKAPSIAEVSEILEQAISNAEHEEQLYWEHQTKLYHEYQEELKRMNFFKRRKEIKKNKASGKFSAPPTPPIRIEKTVPVATPVFVPTTVPVTSEVSSTHVADSTTTPPSYSNSEQEKEKRNKSIWNSKLFHIASITFSLLILISSTIWVLYSEIQTNNTLKLQQQNLSSTLTTEQATQVYKYIIAGDHVAALHVFEQVGYDNLSLYDQVQMLQLYEKTGQNEKAISLNPDYELSLINNLVQSHHTGQIEEATAYVKNQILINYELAFREERYDEVVSFGTDIVPTVRRSNQLLMAYLWLGLYEEADQLAEQEQSKDMTERIANFEKTISQVKKLEDQRDVAQRKGHRSEANELQAQIRQIKNELNDL